jgi:hypothetical protein
MIKFANLILQSDLCYATLCKMASIIAAFLSETQLSLFFQLLPFCIVTTYNPFPQIVFSREMLQSLIHLLLSKSEVWNVTKTMNWLLKTLSQLEIDLCYYKFG